MHLPVMANDQGSATLGAVGRAAGLHMFLQPQRSGFQERQMLGRWTHPGEIEMGQPVSYTHLTLPTKRIV